MQLAGSGQLIGTISFIGKQFANVNRVFCKILTGFPET
jgi:hypothetical protein